MFPVEARRAKVSVAALVCTHAVIDGQYVRPRPLQGCAFDDTAHGFGRNPGGLTDLCQIFPVFCFLLVLGGASFGVAGFARRFRAGNQSVSGKSQRSEGPEAPERACERR